MLFRHADGTAAACACLCTYSVDGSVLVSDGIAGRAAAALKQIAASLTTYKVVFCGLPFSGGQSHLRFDPAADHVSILKSLDEVMLQIAQKDGAKCIVLKEFQDCELPAFDNIASHGYLQADSLPMNQVDIRHPDFDAFLYSLPNRRRRKIAKSLKKFKVGGLRFKWVTDADEVEIIYTEKVHQMYAEMVSRSDTKLELLPRDFFPAMVRELQGECKLCVAKEGNNILAFVLCLETDEELFPMFAGYNYARNREFDLYFNLMYVTVGDLLHACKYVWDAAKIFHHHREQQEAFARERMDRLLSGGVAGVIRGLRRMDTDRKLTGEKLKTINTVCGYLTNNATRMKYDEYLQAGYPIATGVIEGACRYVVKDRMERSGMRWSLPGAQAMLHVRCIHHSTERTQFYKQRILNEQQSLYPTAT